MASTLGVLSMFDRSHARRFAFAFAALLVLPTPLLAQDLVLRASLAGEVQPAEQRQVLRATLRNTSEKVLEIYLPEHRGLVPFPAWELTSQDGAVVHPEAPAFQSMWKQGLQGEVLKLGPGVEASFDTEVTLKPGTWTATCTLAQARAEVTWGKEAFEAETRAWPTLWTGRVQSEPVHFTVGAFVAPRLELALPKSVAVGAPCVAEATVLWPAAAGAPAQRGAFDVTVGTKMYGSARTRWIWNGAAWENATSQALGALPFAVGTSSKCRFDLGAAAYERDDHRGRREFYELLDQGYFYVQVACVDEKGHELCQVSGNGMVEPLGAAPAPGLELRLRQSALGPRHVEVVLANGGTAAHRVPASLAYPRYLAFALELRGSGAKLQHSITFGAASGGLTFDPDDLPARARLSEPLSWSSDAFEHEGSGGSCTVLLAPGSELVRTIDLKSLVTEVANELDRELAVRAFWRNRRADRSSANGSACIIGTLASAELVLPAASK